MLTCVRAQARAGLRQAGSFIIDAHVRARDGERPVARMAIPPPLPLTVFGTAGLRLAACRKLGRLRLRLPLLLEIHLPIIIFWS